MSDQPSDRDLLTFNEAAARLWGTELDDDAAGRRLKYLVYVREDDLNRDIAIRGRGRQRPKLRITMSSIERWLPELRRAPGADVQRRIGDLRKEFRSIARDAVERAIAEMVDPQLREIVEFLNRHPRLRAQKKLRVRCLSPHHNRPRTTTNDDR